MKNTAAHFIGVVRCIVGSSFLSIIAVAATPIEVFAADSLREAIFENCENAKVRFLAQKPEEDPPIFDYLVRVLELSTEVPNVPEAFALLPGIGGNDSAPAPMWQAVDARRELAAKRCALELFEAAGVRGLSALPALAAVYTQQNLSDEIGVRLEEAAAEVAERSRNAGLKPSEDALRKLTQQLEGNHPLVARNILREFFDEALPVVLGRLATVADEKRDQILVLLREGDPDGEKFIRVLLERVETARDEAAILAGILPTPKENVLRKAAPQFAGLAGDPDAKLAQAFARLLAKSCLAHEPMNLPPQAMEAVNRNGQLLARDYLPLAMQQCLVRNVPALADRAGEFLKASQSTDQQHGLSLAPAGVKVLTDAARRKLFGTLQKLAGSSHEQLAPLAIQSLAAFHEQRKETLAALSQLVKRIGSGRQPFDADRLAAIITVLGHLDLRPDLESFVPFLAQLLREGTDTERVIPILARLGAPAEQEMVRILRKGTDVQKTLAISVLDARPALGPATLKVLVEQLGANRVSPLIERVLDNRAKEAAPLMRAAIGRLKGPSRFSALLLLDFYGSATRKERQEIAVLLRDSPCQALVDRPVTIPGYLGRAEDRPRVAGKLMSCIAELGDTAGAKLVRMIPFATFTSARTFESFLPSAAGNPNISTAFAEKIGVEPAPPELTVRVLLELLRHGNRAVQLRALHVVDGNLPASELKPVVRDLYFKSEGDMELREASVLALAKLRDVEFDWGAFVRESIDAAGAYRDRADRMRILEVIPAEVLLAEVTAALKSEDAPKQIGGARIGSKLGMQAVSIVARLWQLRQDASPSVRYAAVLALLEINPLVPEVEESVRRILVNRYYRNAEDSSVRWSETVAVSELNRSSFGQLRRARLMRLVAEAG